MRPSVLVLLGLSLLGILGCGGVTQRPEASDMQGKVTLPVGVSPRDLQITFTPRQNTQPGGAKLAADGSFTVKLVPGEYAYYFDMEANARVPAYKAIPPAYQKATGERVVSVSEGTPITIEVK